MAWKKVGLFLFFGGLILDCFAEACDLTVSVGSNLVSTISTVAGGTIVCLNPGTYGNVHLSNIIKASDVTVRSLSGKNASMYVSIWASSHMKFENLTLLGLELNDNTNHITVSNNTFTGQAVIRTSGSNVKVDGNTFDGISVCDQCYEGRLQLAEGTGIVVTNNHFGGSGESDGIQIGASGAVVGPGNIFDGIVQGNYGRHVDAIQLYGQSHTTITSNYFINNNVQIMAPDGGENEQITNNVFVGSSDYWPSIQLGSHLRGSFTHNTVLNVNVGINKKMENSVKSADITIRDNLMVNSGFSTIDSAGIPSCINCVFDHNLYTQSNEALGISYIIGNPSFVGGSSPISWAGFQLVASPPSLGYRAGSDGKDIGADYFGSDLPSPTGLGIPQRLRIR